MDFPGIGDSIASGDAETHVFETKRNEDISAAIDALEHLGFQKFAVQGVCSGAYHAFYGALSEWRINVAIMINLPTFQWRNVNDVEFLSNMQKNPVSLLIQLRKIEIWRRLLRQGLSGLQSRITMQYVWFKRWMTYIARRYFGAAPSFVEYCTAGLAQRVKSLYIFSEGDPGVDMLNQELGLKRSPPGAVVSIISGLDHALTTPDMRTIACQHIVSILTEDNYSPRAGPMPLGSFG
jgi:pimeloyl-ACP methyl ester carboxylesterase